MSMLSSLTSSCLAHPQLRYVISKQCYNCGISDGSDSVSDDIIAGLVTSYRESVTSCDKVPGSKQRHVSDVILSEPFYYEL